MFLRELVGVQECLPVLQLEVLSTLLAEARGTDAVLAQTEGVSLAPASGDAGEVHGLGVAAAELDGELGLDRHDDPSSDGVVERGSRGAAAVVCPSARCTARRR